MARVKTHLRSLGTDADLRRSLQEITTADKAFDTRAEGQQILGLIDDRENQPPFRRSKIVHVL